MTELPTLKYGTVCATPAPEFFVAWADVCGWLRDNEFIETTIEVWKRILFSKPIDSERTLYVEVDAIRRIVNVWEPDLITGSNIYVTLDLDFHGDPVTVLQTAISQVSF